MGECRLNRMGYVTNYLISGPKETDFINHETEDNQLRYEQYLRTLIADKSMKCPEGEILLGEDSRLGMPWEYYYHYGNWFVDESTFYSTLQKVELDAVTCLDVEEDMVVPAVIWSFAAVDMWCGGQHVGRIDTPVYKPICKREIVLELKKGSNPIYVRLQTLGVRDTRSMFGLQILKRRDEITVSLPDKKHTKELLRAEQWLGNMKMKESVLSFEDAAPADTWLAYDSATPDFAMVNQRKEWQEISGQKQVMLDETKPGVIWVSVKTMKAVLTRKIENILAQKPVYSETADYEENKAIILKRIGSAQSLSRGDKFGFSISNILARKAMGMTYEKDRELLLETLEQIEQRYDCSDFLVCGLVRYIKNYTIDEGLEKRVKEVLLNWRYWMDQKGSDAMCFWSENHSLMFYTCAMNVGAMYPDDYFPRANMNGNELFLWGKEKVNAWLEDVKKHGFEEFLSTVYMCVTFAALLNVIDYSEDKISREAAEITDELLRMLCRHTFDGAVIAPMGRVYREVIHPFEQGAQALMNLINPEVPYSFGEGWLGFFATSKYKLPGELCDLMNAQTSMEYSTGNALVRLEKQKNYCMTSVQSPRMDKGFKRWENLTLLPKADSSSTAYTKSLNERFHGTTCFEPGVYGYQQHMWYAALDKETDVFTNHPGGTCDSSSMRPGYWFGNGVMPAISQEGNVLGAVYCIPEAHPIHFTHLYFPEAKFDETMREGKWILGKKKHGYVGIWCSEDMEAADDQLFGCEYRAYGSNMAYACVCMDDNRLQTIHDFYNYVKKMCPLFDYNNKTLTIDSLKVMFVENHDETQYI